ncbi:MAG TPA: periplasmic heavy metal sensor [Verrucomicrobiae bacterium]|nr:periplasmic heavy metal sensor [Verrucomicrobiae bacterium]
MKRASLILIIGIALAVAGFASAYIVATCSAQSINRSANPEMAWLKQEYKLNNGQYARACELYAAYHPKCLEMCREIDAQNAHLKMLLAATNVVTPEIRQALAGQSELRAKCEANMLTYFYQVSQAMSPEEGKRYLAWMQRETLIPSPMAADNQTKANQ